MYSFKCGLSLINKMFFFAYFLILDIIRQVEQTTVVFYLVIQQAAPVRIYGIIQ